MRRISDAKSNGIRNTFTIPCYPHVKKFILKTHGKSTGQKLAGILTDECTVLGKVVTLALHETRSRVKDTDQYRDRFTESLHLVLTKEQAELRPALEKLIRINIDMDRVFKDHMIQWIHALKLADITPYTACKMYLAHNQIDNTEYSTDAAYRFWQRSKSR